MSKNLSTFEREMQDPGFKDAFDKEYSEFNLSETILALMEEKKMSVRKLASRAHLSPTIIQEVKSGTRQQITFITALKIFNALGCNLELINGAEHIRLSS